MVDCELAYLAFLLDPKLVAIGNLPKSQTKENLIMFKIILAMEITILITDMPNTM